METPKDRAGEATEWIMAAWVRRLRNRIPPDSVPDTSIYNAAYEAAYEVLSKLFPPVHESPEE